LSLKKLFAQREDDSSLCKVDTLVIDILSLYERTINKSHIQIVLDLQVNEQQFVRETLFRQVIANLLLNAIEALNSISSVNKVIRIQSRIEQDGYYSLSLSDNGPGIHPDQEAKMFSLFATSKSSGTGVGLWLSRYVAERHQGSLTFMNLPDNGGVSFTISIPPGVKSQSGGVIQK
jgi:signal transduction histidine kinase